MAETARRFTGDIVLHPYQVDILNANLPLVFLCGPPGTGKTVVLVVRGRDWLCRGWHVHILSTHIVSLAASQLIYHQLQQIDRELQQGAGHYVQRVHLHVFDVYNGKERGDAVRDLVAAASHGQLCVLADEVSSELLPVVIFR